MPRWQPITLREWLAERYAVRDCGYDTPCWVWLKYTNEYGYARQKMRRFGWKSNQRIHRVSYEEYVGPIPEGMEIDHLCRNTSRINPAHLEATTLQVNRARAVAARPKQTHCKNGHEFTPETSRVDANGARFCVPCRRAYKRVYMRARYHRLKDAA